MNRGLRRELALIAGLGALGFLLRRNSILGAILGGVAASLVLVPTKTYSLAGKTVLITGGSRGLGFALAKRCIQEGAQVALLARDPAELERAQAMLQQPAGDRVLTIPCDITQPLALRQAFEQAESYFGQINVLINNAGSISVGPFETLTQADFDAQIELQVYAVIQATRLAIDAFRRVGEGRIANICSIGGALAVPHMATYCTSKFALAGLSKTLASELAPLNIRVTTVYPGLMRTGSPIQAVFKGDHEKEYGWFAAGDVMPGLSVSAEAAAKKILAGIKNGDAQVTYPMITKIGMIGHAVFPEIYALFTRQAARLMPKGTSPIRKTGAESQAWLESQLWYKPFKLVEENAERRLNQAEKFDAEFNLGLFNSDAPRVATESRV